MAKRLAQGHTVAEQELTLGCLPAVCNPSITLVLRKVSDFAFKASSYQLSRQGGAAPHSRDGAAMALRGDRSYRVSLQWNWGQASGISHPANQL